MADEKQTFKIDLDAKEFIASAQRATDALSGIADKAGFEKLIPQLAMIGKSLAVVVAAGAALKGAIELTLEAEAVAKVNRQFEALAENVGLSATEIKEGLSKAVEGLADDTDVLEAASRAMVTLGDAAGRMTEYMELARKTTSVFGGTLLENFEKITMAIGTGNTRLLRQIGLNVDAKAAMVEYARATNQAVAALTESEKRQALANAVLEKGQTILKGTTESTSSATLTLTKIGVEFKQMAETVAVLFERAFGSTIRAGLELFRRSLHSVNNTIKETFGNASEKAEAKADDLRVKIAALTKEVENYEAKLAATKKGTPEWAGNIIILPKLINESKEKLIEYQAELEKISGKSTGSEGEQKTSVARVQITEEEAARKRLIVTKFEADLAALRMQRIDSELKTSDSAVEMETLFQEKKIAIAQAAELQIKAMKDQALIDDPARSMDLSLKIEEIERKKVSDILALEQNLFERKVLFMEQEAKLRARTSEGFALGFKSAAARASVDVGNFAKLGSLAFNSFSNSAVSALMDIGSGSKTAAQAMKGFMFGALADIAQAQGQIMVAKAFLGDFASGAAGAALLVLAGFLRSQAKGSTGGLGGGGTETTAVGQLGGFTAPAFAAPDQSALQASEQAKTKREVTIQIQGHYLDTEGSRRALMDMIRSETDATSFKYVEIGQGA